MAVTLGVIDLAERWILPLLNEALTKTATFFGVDDDQAQDIFNNELIHFAEIVGVGAITLRAKLPLLIVERLGLTSKGFRTKKLLPATQNKVARAKGVTVPITSAAAQMSKEVAEKVVAGAKGSVSGFNSAFNGGLKVLGVTFLGFMVAGNFIDFGNWNSGAYQKTFQKILAKVTFGLLVPDADYRKTKTVSPDVFTKVYNAYKLEGVKGINDPYKLQTVIFTRDTLIDLLDQLGAHLLITQQKASTKDVLLAATALMIFDVQGAPVQTTAPPVVVTPTINSKVFIGVVSQGRLGGAQQFIPRPDDLITSLPDLQQAMENNLTSFLATVAGKIVYETKVVSSILTKDGFRQTGTSRQLQVGTYADGRPKFKTVVNKFAVMRLYIQTDRGTRSKITEIVLGPTDAVAFRPTTAQLQAIQDGVQAGIITRDVEDIKQVTTSQNLAVTTVQRTVPAGAVAIKAEDDVLSADKIEVIDGVMYAINPVFSTRKERTLPEGAFVDRDRHLQTLYRITGGELLTFDTYNNLFTDKERRDLASDSGKFGRIEGRLAEIGITGSTIPTVPFIADVVRKYQGKTRSVDADTFFSGTAPVVTETAMQPSGSGCSSRTLFEWYQSQGQTLPKVEERSVLYQELGLGQDIFYTGTAEQNAKLLTELQRRAGCSVI